MCEWLSCREWCDVKLLCGGRTLPAHRAVLASVSTFLRRILLSRPSEESPTFIVLPDFDIDAMTSVLYYVYNGEVIIQKHKLDMFMEIVKAMQIFVDEQYLSTSKKDQVSNLNVSQKVVGKPALFSLGEDSKCSKLIKLRKGDKINDILEKYKAKEMDCLDATFRKVQSSYEDRQRSAVLRDLFIETYPQNGNANGRAAGVPAIPSGSYLGASSELLTNANANHLACGNKRDEPHRKKSLFEYHDSTMTNQYNEKKSDNTINLAKFSCRNSFNSICTNMNTRTFLNLSIENKLMDNFGSVQSNFNTMEASCSIELNRKNQDNCYANFNWSMKCRANEITNRSNAVKNAILNQVLESPWCPRQPTNFRPCRRKQILTKPEVTQNYNIKKDTTVNDDNNNLQIELHIHPDRVSPKLETCRDVFKCNICDQVFSDTNLLVAHSRQHGTAARYSCTECSKSFSQLRNYKYHMSIHRGTREFAATCTVCGKYFNDRGYLSSHMKIHRNRKEYKCTQCPKSFNQRVAYNMHVRIHTGVKPHVCNECGKAFSRKMLLKQHQRTHSGERPYACPHCDKRFADRSNMTLHLRLHTGIKPFSCTLCPKSFTKKHHLKSHLNFHTGAKPYSCPRCKLAFTQSSNMRTHLKKCKVPELLSQAISTLSS